MTFPDCFKEIHLAVCASTNDYLKENIASLEPGFPVMVSAAAQTAGRGRESRSWISPENLGLYATFGFHLPDKSGLSLLSIASGIAVCDMLQRGNVEAVLGWPEKFFARFNGLLPRVVDGALRKQLPVIRRYASEAAAPRL